MRGLKRAHWPMVDGSMFVPENHMMAKASQTYRSAKMWAQLGGATLAAIADVPIYASQVNYSGGSFLGGMFEGMGAVFKGVKSPEMMAMAAELGVIADNMRNTTMSRFDVDSMIPGSASAVTEKFFNLNLLTPWSDRLRMSFAMSLSNRYGNHRGKMFKNLPAENQRQLRQFNIDEAEWDVLRAGAEKNIDGRQYLTPESVADLPDSVIEAYLDKIGKAKNKSNLSKYRAEIADRARSMFNATAHNASLVPDAGTRGMMIQGTRAGTIVGEGWRNVLMYKSFPMAIVRQILGTEVYGYSSNLTGMGALKDPAAMLRMSRMVIASTLFGAVAMTAKEVAKGQEPSIADPEQWRTSMARSLLQGGALGIYGDFLVGEMKNRYGGNAVSTLVGPMGSDVAWAGQSISDIWGVLLRGDVEAQEAGADALQYMLRQVPGNNIFYTKMAYDYLLTHSLMELADPGSLRAMEQRKLQDVGTQYFAPPSQFNLMNSVR
jgi:hypothetical protein